MSADEIRYRLRKEHVVGDRCDLLRLPPVCLELRELAFHRNALEFFVSGHLEGESHVFGIRRQSRVVPTLRLTVAENLAKVHFWRFRNFDLAHRKSYVVRFCALRIDGGRDNARRMKRFTPVKIEELSIESEAQSPGLFVVGRNYPDADTLFLPDLASESLLCALDDEASRFSQLALSSEYPEQSCRARSAESNERRPENPEANAHSKTRRERCLLNAAPTLEVAPVSPRCEFGAQRLTNTNEIRSLAYASETYLIS